MGSDKFQVYRSLAKHFSAICGVPLTLVDDSDRVIRFTETQGAEFFCDKCPNRCRLLSTMLYGCSEARRWRGRYVYYCPIGLVFSAVLVPETDLSAIAGPLVMGEPQDTLLDLPEYIDKERISTLSTCSSQQLRHMSALLELAVSGLTYRPEAAYDRNVVQAEKADPEDQAALHNSFPYMRQLEETLRQAIQEQNEPRARETLNNLLRYVYSPHPDQLPLIRSRAIQLVYLLAKIAAMGDAGQKETELYRQVHIPALKNAATLEELDITLAQMLHLFVDYSFDFAQIRHSDTIYRVMDYIKSNYARKLTLEEIASFVHLSGSHISGMFRKETGQTISAYINFVRIEKSKQLLKTSPIPIAEIGSLCGFEDQSYFSRVFRQQTGLSPKKYRDTLQ